MRKAEIIVCLIALTFLGTSCGSTEPAPVQVIGAAEDLVPLTGEWSGTYDGGASGRSGTITFHLTDNPEGAHGDVLMVPRQQFVYERPPHEVREQSPQAMHSSSSLLSIEFVRIRGGEIGGKIAPYPDPENPQATLETHFTGRLEGEWIEGTFVTYSDRGVSPRRGTWKVHRKPAG
jgi:hypothetical protein